MRFPGYPSNREADKGRMMSLRAEACGKARPADEAKPGDLFPPLWNPWGWEALFGFVPDLCSSGAAPADPRHRVHPAVFICDAMQGGM